MTDELGFAGATTLLECYRERSLSPVDVAQAVLNRIERLNGLLNAFCLVDAEAALAAARASEARWMRGEPCGRLDGVPVTIKDLMLTRGWPTLRGSRTVDPGGPWDVDAPCVARLREHGAVLLGKTTTPEFGWKGVTDGPLSGITRNPWNPDLTPGGSSGGAAAALAGGMGALGIGTDGGGSIRIPCGFTGTFGIKASFGRVPAWPPSVMGTLSHVGPMGRTVDDVALMLTVIAKPDPRDWASLPYDGTDWTAGIDQGVAGLRVAYSATLGYANVDSEVAATVALAARRFEELGARVEACDPGFDDPRAMFRALWWVGAAGGLADLPDEKMSLMEPELRQVIEEGAHIPLLDYQAAINGRFALGTRMRLFHRDYDLLLTPALAVPAFEAGRLRPAGWPDDDPDHWLGWTPFSYPFNLTQQPACSINCGFSADGRPIGLQIVADNYREDLVLRAAKAFESLRGPVDWPRL